LIGNLAVAAKLNREYEGLVRFETVLWEEHFYTADKSFQPQIPEAVASDIVVSIFWTRIGTEPPADFPRMANGKPYPSGTAYELLTALEASKAKGVPDVYVFRKIADGTLPIDAERRRQAQTQLDALEAFWSEWFRSQTGEFKAAFQNFRRRMHSNSSLSSCCGSGSRRGAYSARGSLGRRKRVRRFRDWRRSRLSMRGHGWNFRKGQRAPQPDSEQFRSSPGRRSATVDRVV
jgi:hypothetical protein